MMTRELFRNRRIQQFPVRASPAVDTLLDISDNKVFPTLGITLMKQRAEIAPLNIRRILELIQKEMLIPDSQFLIYERCIRTVDYITKNCIGIINAQYILLLHQLLESPAQFSRNAKSVELAVKNQSSIIYLELLVEKIAEIFKRRLQERVYKRFQLCSLALCEPLLMIHCLGHE